MIFKSPVQPYCRTCGKPIAKFTGTIWLEKEGSAMAGKSMGEYWRHVVGEATTKSDCQKYTNHTVISVNRSGDTIRSFNWWDGESYKDEFFCTGSCARQFAYMAAHLHPTLVTKRYNEAAAKRREGKYAEL